MLDMPYYTDTVSDAGGGDPLGNALVNEMLYRSTFPGINNVVRYIRVYSAICWMVRQIEATAQRNPDEDLVALSNAGLEKIQLLLTWYNVRRGVRNLAGGGRLYPKGTQRVKLSFTTLVGRRDAKAMEADSNYMPSDGASYLDAVQYGPSLFNGLRLLKVTTVPGFFGLTEAGIAMADGYEAAIQGHERRKWLADLSKLTVSDDEVMEMGELLDVFNPSEAEIQAFVDQYFPATLDTAIGPNWRNRHQGLMLVLRALEAEQAGCKDRGEKGVSLEALRYAMARGCAQDGAELTLTGLEEIHGCWANLQLRQYLRTAQDTLFRLAEAWVHDAVVYNRPRDINDCAEGLGAALQHQLPAVYQESVGSLLEDICAWKGERASLYAAAPLLPPTARLENLRFDLERRSDFALHQPEQEEALRDAYFALLYCACEGENLRSNPHIVQQFPTDRLSLIRLQMAVGEYLDATPAQFMAHIVQYHVLLQHFQVVLERSGDGRNRYRILKADNGLERVLETNHKFSEVSILQDRLARAVDLLVQCGLMKEVDEGRYTLTPESRKRLRNPLILE
ncbi:hypothetical protein [Cupriavidus necator]